MPEGVYKFFSPTTSDEFVGEFPCDPENQALIDSLKATYSNQATVLDFFRSQTPPLGENFTLVEELEIPAQAPQWLAPLPKTPSMLPVPNYPFNQVNVAEYYYEEYAVQTIEFTDPTPQTQTLLVRLIIIMVVTTLKELFQKYGAFVPLFLEPHLLLSLLLGEGKRPTRGQYG